MSLSKVLIEAADDLYAACVGQIPNPTAGQKEALERYANASNAQHCGRRGGNCQCTSIEECTQQSPAGNGCILCANGNDLPKGEYCRSCGREGNAFGLGAAVIKARGRSEPPSVPVRFGPPAGNAAVEADLRAALEFGVWSCSGPINDAEVKMLEEQIEETWQEYRAALQARKAESVLHEDAQGFHHVIKGERVPVTSTECASTENKGNI